MANNIIDSIQLSGVTYQIQGSGGGGVPESTFTAYTATTDERISQDEEVTAAGLNALNSKITPTVELTQAQYDALVDKDPNTYYIITDAQAVDLTNYYTKSETNTLLGGKQETLVSGTNIKTINNESILGSGNIDIQGGSTYTAGRGISIANDTISFSLPISAGTGTNSIIEGYTSNKASGGYSHAEGQGTTASGIYSHAEGYNTTASGYTSHAEGWYTQANGKYSHAEGYFATASGNYSHAEGYSTSASGQSSHAEGQITRANNQSEHASGQFNVSSKASNTFGDSGNTLFSVGNGTADNARHNAFEIRQNGDIYLTKDGQDVKLQDQLGGGGSITVDTALSSTSENPVQNKVIYNKIDEVEQVTAASLNALNDKIGDIETLLSQI
jgi:hypothetical protein